MATSSGSSEVAPDDEPIGRIRVIVIDCADLDRAMRFWSGLLGVEPADRMEQYWWTSDVAPGIRLTLQRVDDAKRDKARVHFDLTSDDPAGLIARAVALGGSIVDEVEHREYALTVMADPDGNEFCINRRLSSELSSRRDGHDPGQPSGQDG